MGVISTDPVNVANALGNLSSALEALTAIGKQVEQRYNELEAWEEKLKLMEKEISKREEELKAKENEFLKKSELSAVQEEEREEEEEEPQGERIVRGTLRDCKFSTKILLNVGM